MPYHEASRHSGIPSSSLAALGDNPLVSVIVPVYNGADFIVPAVDSALRQSYLNLEVLVVDDGSTDDTLSLLNEIAARDPRVRVLTQANSGVASARNHAIRESRGEFIAPLDADDLWLPDKIQRQLRALLRAGEDAGFAYSWWAWIDEQGMVLDRSPRWTITGDVLPQLIFINFTGNASVPLFRKQHLLEAGGYDPTLAANHAGGCEDWQVVLRVAARHPVAFVPDVLVGYRRRRGSMSSALDTMWRSKERVMAGIRELRPDLPPALFRASDNQFRMYLAGLAFASGNRAEAFRQGVRAGVRLPVAVSPFVLRMMLLPRKPARVPLFMEPGASLDTRRIPEPLVPYDRINVRGFLHSVLGLLRGLLYFGIHRLQWVFHLLILLRLRGETYLGNRSSSLERPRRPRVLASACWHFPIYSQTFVYRELTALARAGFDVRLAYAGLTARRNLPTDCTDLWPLRRRIMLSEFTGARDLRHFQRIMPSQVEALVRAISAASGLTEAEIYAHPHFLYALSFTRVAQALQPDYIHTYFFYESTLFGYVASTLLGIPRGISCYADHMVPDYDLKLTPLHVDTSSVIVATSARIKQELEDIAGRSLPQAIVKPNAIDASIFDPGSRPVSVVGAPVRIVAVCRIHPKKGLTYLADAARLLRDAGLTFTIDVLGEPDGANPQADPYFLELNSFIEDHRLQKHFRLQGRKTGAEVHAALTTADIFVAPFVELPNGDKDGIPTALLEAMAAGCAIVTTDAGSITEVVDNEGQGLMVPQCDSAALARAIERLIKNPDFRYRLAKSAVERARAEFDITACEPRFHQRVAAAIAADRTHTA